MQPLSGKPDFQQMHSAIWQLETAKATGSATEKETVRGTYYFCSLYSFAPTAPWFTDYLPQSAVSSISEV